MFGDFMETNRRRLENSKERRQGEGKNPREEQWPLPVTRRDLLAFL